MKKPFNPQNWRAELLAKLEAEEAAGWMTVSPPPAPAELDEDGNLPVVPVTPMSLADYRKNRSNLRGYYNRVQGNAGTYRGARAQIAIRQQERSRQREIGK